MTSDKRFGLLRNLLRAIGLSIESADQAVDFVVELLTGEGKAAPDGVDLTGFPYVMRANFLSPAELSFYGVLRTTLAGRAAIQSKVGLGDIFTVKIDDAGKFRSYANKIDRKHVDFLLCDPELMRPIVGIELDDRSHQREDRQARDAFVDQVFAAAQLPLVHVPARRGYVTAEIAAMLAPYLTQVSEQPELIRQPKAIPLSQRVQQSAAPAIATAAKPTPAPAIQQAPTCPKCGSDMMLRTAKSGTNAGNQFWGCSKYPACKGIVQIPTRPNT